MMKDVEQDWEREFLKAEIYLIEQKQEIEKDFYNKYKNKGIPAKIKFINFNIEKDEKSAILPF